LNSNKKKNNMDTNFDADGDSVCISHPPAGAGTALLGKEAAMACTVAVEEVIGDHYNRYTSNGTWRSPVWILWSNC